MNHRVGQFSPVARPDFAGTDDAAGAAVPGGVPGPLTGERGIGMRRGRLPVR